MLKCGTKAGIFYLSMGHFAADFYNNFLPVLLPLIMVKLDMSLTMCGVLVMVLAFMASTIQPFVGYVVDRHDCGSWLVWAVPLCGLFICLAGYAPNQPVLFLLCALMGLMVAIIHPLGIALLDKVGTAKYLGRYMSFYIVSGNVGFAIVPVVVTAFIEYFSLELLPLLAIPGFLLGAAYYFSGIYCLPSANAKKSRLARENGQDRGQNISFREIVSNRAVVMLNAAQALRCWTHVAVSTFLPLVLLSHGYSSMMAGSLLAVFLLGSAAGGISGGELGDRFGHKRLIVTYLAVSALPILFFFEYPDAGIWSMLALFLGGACSHGTQPSSIVWTGRLMPKYIGVASGMMMGLCFGLGSVGAAITAALGDYVGLETAMLLSVLPMAVAAIITALTPYPKVEG